MKFNAIVICSIISIVLFILAVILFPIVLILELISFLIELGGNSEYYHNVWARIVFAFINAVKTVYKRLLEVDLNTK